MMCHIATKYVFSMLGRPVFPALSQGRLSRYGGSTFRISNGTFMLKSCLRFHLFSPRHSLPVSTSTVRRLFNTSSVGGGNSSADYGPYSLADVDEFLAGISRLAKTEKENTASSVSSVTSVTSGDVRILRESVMRFQGWLSQGKEQGKSSTFSPHTSSCVELLHSLSSFDSQRMPPAVKVVLQELVRARFSNLVQAAIESSSSTASSKESIAIFFKAVRTVGISWNQIPGPDQAACTKLIGIAAGTLDKFYLDAMLIDLAKLGLKWVGLERQVRIALLQGCLRVARDAGSKTLVLSLLLKLDALKFSYEGLPQEVVLEARNLFEYLLMEQFEVMSADKALDATILYLNLLMKKPKSEPYDRLKLLITAFQDRFQDVSFVKEEQDVWRSGTQKHLAAKKVKSVLFVLAKLGVHWSCLHPGLRTKLSEGLEHKHVFVASMHSLALTVKSLADMGLRVDSKSTFDAENVRLVIDYVNQLDPAFKSKLDVSMLLIGLAKLGFNQSDLSRAFIDGVFTSLSDGDSSWQMDVFTLLWGLGRLGLAFPFWPSQAKEAVVRSLKMNPLQHSTMLTYGGYVRLNTCISAFDAVGMTATDVPIEFWITYMKYLNDCVFLMNGDFLFKLLVTLKDFGVHPIENFNFSSSCPAPAGSSNPPQLSIVLDEREIEDYTPLYAPVHPPSSSSSLSSSPSPSSPSSSSSFPLNPNLSSNIAASPHSLSMYLPPKLSMKLSKHIANQVHNFKPAELGLFMSILADPSEDDDAFMDKHDEEVVNIKPSSTGIGTGSSSSSSSSSGRGSPVRALKTWIFSTDEFRKALAAQVRRYVDAYQSEIDRLRDKREGLIHKDSRSTNNNKSSTSSSRTSQLAEAEIETSVGVTLSVDKDKDIGIHIDRDIESDRDVEGLSNYHLANRRWLNLDDVLAALSLAQSFEVATSRALNQQHQQQHKHQQQQQQQQYQDLERHYVYYVRHIVKYLGSLPPSQLQSLSGTQRANILNFLDRLDGLKGLEGALEETQLKLKPISKPDYIVSSTTTSSKESRLWDKTPLIARHLREVLM